MGKDFGSFSFEQTLVIYWQENVTLGECIFSEFMEGLQMPGCSFLGLGLAVITNV